MLTWADAAKYEGVELKVPFETDEIALMDKIRSAWQSSKDAKDGRKQCQN